jgi:3'(2'), 5'-bisphosphate nucleotidase
MSDAGDLHIAVEMAADAGALLIKLRRESFLAGLEPKAVGAQGDFESNRLLIDALRRLRPHDAVLSEEAADDLARLEASRVWIIDPLDGTREYSEAGRDDWAVHVALWERDGGITTAAVGLPALGIVLSGAQRDASGMAPEPVPLSASVGGPIRTVVSRSRPPAWLGPLGELIELDQAAGFHASRLDGAPLVYNQPSPYLPDLMICRPELAEPLLAALRLVGAR